MAAQTHTHTHRPTLIGAWVGWVFRASSRDDPVSAARLIIAYYCQGMQAKGVRGCVITERRKIVIKNRFFRMAGGQGDRVCLRTRRQQFAFRVHRNG